LFKRLNDSIPTYVMPLLAWVPQESPTAYDRCGNGSQSSGHSNVTLWDRIPMDRMCRYWDQS